MSTRMLIDARHKEETRVTVIRGNRVEEFDYESAHKAQIKGNIYLAKVTRVEPSLQAAFVEYGGNRHGFLAFSEIHPDYYQIPIADREALLAEERAANARDAEDEEKQDAAKGKKKSAKKKKSAGDAGASTGDSETPDTNAGAIPDLENDALGVKAPEPAKAATDANGDAEANSNAGNTDDADNKENNGGEDNGEGNNGGDDGDDANADEDEMEETIRKRRSMRSLRRRYKIQEVIKRRQILLVQVVKEERGTKGAALTTYLSLAGRYCVLMPNSTHGGGVSRKISNAADRRKLKTILGALEGPQGIGCIIRTAGLQRTKAEIKRDYDYLLKLWESIRDLTLKSVAPALIYEEGNLIKRSIRDLYDRSIDEVLVEGEEAYKAAKGLMKLLMPSHAKRVQHYQEKIPLFHRYQVEEQLDSMFNPVVTLKSGGYLVINPTEALISIDVNSGRSTREHNIEETALKTNLEASDEIGRQLRLRDMAGLIVIDYIDMEYRGNNRKIERRLKDALKADRARIQVGRISQFGLMEMSRQRLRPNLVEASTITCSHCEGTGRARTIASSALHVLRALEEEGIRERSARLSLSVPGEVASYILNAKRGDLHEMEQKYGLRIAVLSDNKLVAPHYELTRSGTAPDGGEVSEVLTDKPDAAAKPSRRVDNDQDAFSGKGKRRRRRRGREDKPEAVAATPATENAAPQTGGESETGQDGDEDKPRKRRRRGRRGGRRRRAAIAAGAETGTAPEETAEAGSSAAATPPEAPVSDNQKAATQPAGDSTQPAGDSTKTGGEKAAEKKPARRRGRTAAAKPDAHSGADQAAAGPETEKAAATTAEASAAATEAKPGRSRKSAAKKAGAKKADKTVADTGKPEGKTGDTAAKAPARKTRAKSGGKETQEAKTESKAEKPVKEISSSDADAKAGNGSTAQAATTKAASKKADSKKSAPAAEAKKEKTKRGWWQRSS